MKERSKDYRRIYFEYVGKNEDERDIHHIDGNRCNDDISNLVALSKHAHHDLHNFTESVDIRRALDFNCDLATAELLLDELTTLRSIYMDFVESLKEKETDSCFRIPKQFWNIEIDHVYLNSLGLDIDIKDWLIAYCIKVLFEKKWLSTDDSGRFAVPYIMLLRCLPLLKITHKKGWAKRFDKLVVVEVLEHAGRDLNGQKLYRTGKNFSILFNK